jgi:flagellar hook-length control protein FliK
MNLTALPELLLAWVKNQGAALLQGDKAQPVNLQPGQQYDGKVINNLTSGRFLVQVGNQMLDMNLPARTQPGETVRLTYINASPRPAFLLNQAAISPVRQVQISNTAQQVNALLRLAQTPSSVAPSAVMGGAAATSGVATPVAASASVPATPISTRPIVANVSILQNYAPALPATTATLTGPNTGLLSQAVDAPRAAVPASATLSANTLVELPTPSRHLLPLRLSQTLSESGVFYEAHLAKWSKGALPLEAILREPQARLGAAASVPANLAELGDMPEDAARFAGRQLQMLEGAPFLWQGYAWPGQRMDWLVQEHGGDGAEAAGHDAPEWVTELHLALPNMGAIDARLDLTGARLRLRLAATESATRETLQAALPQLLKGLEASGLQPLELKVEAPHAVG